jgi:uncharacterized sulfatase
MIRWPGKVTPRESPDLARSIDIAPTILALLGQMPTPEMQGVNLLDDRARSARKSIQGACFTHNAVDLDDPARNLLWRWMVEGRWKAIVPAAVPAADGTPRPAPRSAELYDLAADPHEERDLAAAEPERLEAMRANLDAWWKPGR